MTFIYMLVLVRLVQQKNYKFHKQEKKNFMRIVVSGVDRLDEHKKQLSTKMSIETVSLL